MSSERIVSLKKQTRADWKNNRGHSFESKAHKIRHGAVFGEKSKIAKQQQQRRQQWPQPCLTGHTDFSTEIFVFVRVVRGKNPLVLVICQNIEGERDALPATGGPFPNPRNCGLISHIQARGRAVDTSIACIGSGNMGRALMKGAAGVVSPGNIGFSDVDRAKAQALAKELGGARCYLSNYDAVKEADFVFLAVKPQALGTVLEEIAPALRMRPDGEKPVTLVSMAAGWDIKRIQILLDVGSVAKLIGPDWSEYNPVLTKAMPVVRIMPNTPALISQGVIAMAASQEVSEEALGTLEQILGAAGIVDRIDEAYMDAVTGLSGSGPAFVYLFIEALADGGVQAGLPRDKALRYAAQTVLGAAMMVQETGLHPGQLKDVVASPGGTTIAGIAALENGAFRGTVMNAVAASFNRSKTLG